MKTLDVNGTDRQSLKGKNQDRGIFEMLRSIFKTLVLALSALAVCGSVTAQVGAVPGGEDGSVLKANYGSKGFRLKISRWKLSDESTVASSITCHLPHRSDPRQLDDLDGDEIIAEARRLRMKIGGHGSSHGLSTTLRLIYSQQDLPTIPAQKLVPASLTGALTLPRVRLSGSDLDNGKSTSIVSVLILQGASSS